MPQVGKRPLSPGSRPKQVGPTRGAAAPSAAASAILICLLVVLVLRTSLISVNATEGGRWRWHQASPVPQARSEVSVAGDGKYIYFLGGFAAGPNIEEPSLPNGVFRYDPQSDRWTVLPPLSEGLHHAGLVVLDDKLFLIGGYRGTSWEPLADVQVLDLEAGSSWRQASPMPTARGALALTTSNGRIHAIGGHDGEKSLAVHEIYDPASDQWSAAAPIAFPRNHHASAALDRKIYIFGGRDEATAEMDSTEVYDPAADRWDHAAPLPTGRSGVAAAVIDGRAVVFGGETFGARRKTFDEAELYDPQSDSWSSLPAMPHSRHGLGAATIGSRIHVIAGGPTAGLSYSAENSYLERSEGSR
ncbi:kelch repeat-containing protein [Chelativorans sp. J32]|uniref:Kelch repeat-containing protein n=1 Tax=Chelativorans sp. J32 TaxID=935840 RepID=UPI0004B41FE4|nr:kelch repeat-containing protein [Chelativorans sp. J32]